ncbi:hypothetical protein [Streptomyces tagetis]|uniref:Integral-membrane protein n=1 Tax=Streptomyces tagetis TaxID=2820809 RepID=A0A940XCW8_9ACTN|nr:hypothetical protein [Streptomyces sp. RG38]MBQ0826219.1 hypothetical protein [Streptomyces sp. RG38]
MTAGWASRTVRAAVFAAVCVLLAALGHVLMSGTPVPWWALTAGTAATGGAAWRLAGRERGRLLVGSVTVAAQTALHTAFSLAQALASPGPSDPGALAGRWRDHLLCAAHDGMAASAAPMDHHAHHGVSSALSGAGGAADPAAAAQHTMGGLSPAGMLAAHLLAALLCGLWLAHGERAAFRIVRALAGWFVAPLRPLLRPALPPPPADPHARRTGDVRCPRRLLLAHAITSRGPPAVVAVA